MWAALIQAAVQQHVGAAVGVANYVKSNEEKNAQIRRDKARFTSALTTLDEMYRKGELDLQQFMERVDSFAKELGTDFTTAVNAATQKGVEAINMREQAAIGDIKKNLEFMKEDASEAERKEIERYERELSGLEKNLAETQKNTRIATTQRRLNGASQISALRKNQGVFNEAMNKASELSTNVRRDISYGLNRAINQTNQQLGSLGLNFGAQLAEFQGQQGDKLATGMMGIKQNAFSQKEGARQKFNDLAMDINAQRGQINANVAGMQNEKAPDFGEAFLAGLSGFAGASTPMDFGSMLGGSTSGGEISSPTRKTQAATATVDNNYYDPRVGVGGTLNRSPSTKKYSGR